MLAVLGPLEHDSAGERYLNYNLNDSRFPVFLLARSVSRTFRDKVSLPVTEISTKHVANSAATGIRNRDIMSVSFSSYRRGTCL